jgi:hypothetical protein
MHEGQATNVEGEMPGPATRPQRRSVLLAGTMAAILSIVAFAPSWKNGFVYDDLPIIMRNSSVTQSGPWYRFWTQPYWPSKTDVLYRPLTIWSFRVNTVLAPTPEPDPRWFHPVNIAIHALTAVGVAVLAWRVSGLAVAAWIAGALFAVHPLLTEAVVTGYGRAELMAACFGVWLLARHLVPPEHRRGPRWAQHLVNTLLFAGAIMSKEHAVLLWPVLLATDAMHRLRRPSGERLGWREWFNRTLAPAHLGLVLVITVFFMLRFSIFNWRYRLEPIHANPWQNPFAGASFTEHLLTPFRLLWTSFELLWNPARLCPVWSVPATPLADRLAPDVIGGICLSVGLFALLIVLWYRRSLAAVLVAGLILMLILPVHAVPAANWLFAERWLYLAAVFAAALIGVALARLGPLTAPVALAVAVALLPATWSYIPAFSSNLTMASETVRRQPDSFQGRIFFGTMLYYEKQYAAAIAQANEMIERFGVAREPCVLMAESYLALAEPRRALDSLQGLERLPNYIPDPSIAHLIDRAHALLEPPTSAPASTQVHPARSP